MANKDEPYRVSYPTSHEKKSRTTIVFSQYKKRNAFDSKQAKQKDGLETLENKI